MMTKKIKTKLSFMQGFWLIVGSLASLGGFVLAVLGVLRDFLNMPYEQNWIRIAENEMNAFLSTNLPWHLWGTILLIAGGFILAIWIHRLATAEELAKEKAIRRAQRLQDTTVTE
jgi:hypothetical protein